MPDLLVHIPEYGVAVCSECQYAVQPTALSKHLLRHGVYRNERQAQLARFQNVSLLEPEDVLPPLGVESIPHLPLYEGRRCMANRCAYTCISEKRMRQHWREQHRDQQFADRPAFLQTFFRGNKLRYFEVYSTRNTTTIVQPRSQIQANGTYVAGSLRESKDTKHDALLENKSPITAPFSQFDLDAMELMHYCTISTCSSLNRATESVEFFQTTIIRDAFEHDYLLFGLLCLTASHVATETTDGHKRDRYRQISAQYQAFALPGFRKALTNPSRENAHALIMCSRLIGIHNFVDAFLKWEDCRWINQMTPEEATSSIISSVTLLRGTIHAFLDLQQFLSPGSEFLLSSEMLNDLQAIKGFNSLSGLCSDLSISSAVSSPVSAFSNSFLTQNFDRLSLLQDHLAVMIASEDEVTASVLVLSFDMLKQSFQLALHATHLRDLWNALEMWPRMVSSCLIDLLACRHRCALLLFAYWVVLSKPLEPHYWFLHGQPGRLLESTAFLLEESYRRFLPQLK